METSEFREIEKKWQKKWEEEKIFEANPNEKNKFFLTVPYPYVSGPAHVGHGRSYVLGDITARFYRLLGFNVLWPMAWHLTGTPVLAVAKRIKNGESGVIEEHIGYVSLHQPEKAKDIVKLFTDPKNVAEFYSSVWKDELTELGCSIDWRRMFDTGEKIYNKFVEWQYHCLNSSGYLKKGKHPVFFCPSCGNPVTTDDVKSGDMLEMSITEFYLIKEKFEDGYLISATLRPETIFGIVNIWINPDVVYVKAKVGNEVWYVSEVAAVKLKNQGFPVEIVEKISGKNFIGKKVFIPFAERDVLILPANFVEAEVGTGVVNSVPAHAPYDFIALEDLKRNERLLEKFNLNKEEIMRISPISLFYVEGASEYPAIDAVKKMEIKSQMETEKLEKATQEVYNKEYYFGVLKDVCKGFSGLKISEAKLKVFDALVKVGVGSKMFEAIVKDLHGNVVKEVRCRCGERVIVKVLEEQWFLDYANEEWKEKTRNAMESIEILPEIYRRQFIETIDWLHEWACTRSRGLGTKFPYDNRFVIESLSDSTIYMAFYTIVHLIRERNIQSNQLNKEFFDFVFLGKGSLEEVEKATGIEKNVLERMRKEFLYWYPMDERRTSVAHISNHLTFMVFHHVAIFPPELLPKRISLNELLIAEGRKMSKSLGNVVPLTQAIRNYGADSVRLYLTWASEAISTLNWREKEVDAVRKRIVKFYSLCNQAINSEKGNLSLTGRQLISRFYKNLEEATDALKKYLFKQYVQKIFFETLNEMESFIQRSNDIYPIREVLSQWLIALSPVIPHLSEEIWHKLGNKSFVSCEKWPEILEIDENLLELENIFRKCIEDLRHVCKLAGKKNNAYIYVESEKELQYFKEGLDYIKRTFGFKKVEIFLASDVHKYDPMKKSEKAKYGKPGIYLE